MKKILIILFLIPYLGFTQGYVGNSGGPSKGVAQGIVNGNPGFVSNNTPPGSIDADVQAWATATGITDAGVINAYNIFVVGWKSANYWTNTKFIHPYTTDAGTGAPALAQMVYNLKDPRNLDIAFRLTPSGGGSPVYTSAGYQNGGAGCWLTTHAPPASVFSSPNALTVILGISTNVNAFENDFGSTDFSGTNRNLFIKVLLNNIEGTASTAGATDMSISAPTSKGLWFLTRTGATAEAFYKNNSSTAWNTGATASVALGATQEMFVGALSNAGSGVNPSTKTYVIDIAYDGLIVGSDVVIMGNLINDLQKNLETAQGLTTGTRSWF